MRISSSIFLFMDYNLAIAKAFQLSLCLKQADLVPFSLTLSCLNYDLNQDFFNSSLGMKR